MKKLALSLTFVATAFTLAACSSNPYYDLFLKNSEQKNATQPSTGETADSALTPPPPVESVGSIGGSLSRSMDANDRARFARALDNPLGKSTTWFNKTSNISFTVTPTNKLSVNGNPYCRAYSVSASRDGRSQQSAGTACVGSDGNWKSVSGG